MIRSRDVVLGLALSLGWAGPLAGQVGAREAHAAEQDTDEDAQPDKLPALPAGLTLDLIREGDEIFRGKGGCAGCHGADATGMPNEGSALTAGLHFIPVEWEAIDSLVTAGVPELVTRTTTAMPPRGAMANLTAEEIRKVSAYVWAISQVRDEPWPGGHAKHPPVEHAGMEPMMMEGPLGIPMNRDASGTAWLPDSSPMYMRHKQEGDWTLMFHGNAFLQYITEGGDRGDDQFGSINWLMGMAHRKVAGGDLQLRLMMSAEPFTVGECGYPDLLATGEFCNGAPLHDRQHPHDLFMELSAGYQREISKSLAVQVYGGPVGEPALGPVAYPHRVSALPNPIAPIAHHWLDATHISFGVVTAGIFGRRWKLEGSVFNGREPDENRYDFDFAPLDSYSGRLWLMPSPRWAFQISVGRLNEVEPAQNGMPAETITRPTASVTYQQPLFKQGVWATTFSYGANVEDDVTTSAYLVESNLNLRERHILYGRAELVEKTATDLVLDPGAFPDQERVFRVGAIAVGFQHQFGGLAGLVPGVGARVSLNLVPTALQPVYANDQSLGLALYVSLRPAPIEMGGMMHGGRRQGARRTPGEEHQQEPQGEPSEKPPHEMNH